MGSSAGSPLDDFALDLDAYVLGLQTHLTGRDKLSSTLGCLLNSFLIVASKEHTHTQPWLLTSFEQRVPVLWNAVPADSGGMAFGPLGQGDFYLSACE